MSSKSIESDPFDFEQNPEIIIFLKYNASRNWRICSEHSERKMRPSLRLCYVFPSINSKLSIKARHITLSQ